ncbi:Protein argonaute 16 [Linum perenne]
MAKEASQSPLVLPSPPPVSSDAKPEQVTKTVEHVDLPKHSIMSRKGFGTQGRRIPLLTNHFKISVGAQDAVFYQYSVSITSEDRVVEGKGIGRKLIDKLYQTYSSEFAGKRFAYDGEKALYTVGPLPQNKLDFTVVLEDSIAKGGSEHGSPSSISKRTKCSIGSKTFKIEISYAAKIPLKPVVLALKGTEEDSSDIQDALRVLDIILRQQAASRGCLLVRQSFFHDDSRNYTDVGEGVSGLRGFHSSFRTTQGGLSLNMDVSTTMVLTPGPVIDFLFVNQNVKEPRYIDWDKAKKMLKNLRIKTTHNNREFKIIGLSEKPCKQQLFSMRARNGAGAVGESDNIEITVYEYFAKHCGIELRYSAHLPCLNVGKPKKPVYLPFELCSLTSLQRYTKALSSTQRASLVEKSRQKPQDRIRTVTDAMRKYRYEEDPLLLACGISLEKSLTQVTGRVLETPKLKVGKSEDCIPNFGRWNFNNKTLLEGKSIERWAVVNFSAQCDTSRLSRELIACGKKKGMHIEGPKNLIEEPPHLRRSSPLERVETMFELVREKLPGAPEFILCLLPQRKNSDIYGPWKKKCLSDFGIVTQCISPPRVIKDQYLTNVLLKINSKLGGINSMLAIEHSRSIPLITHTPTMILGMDVSHGSPGRSDVPSVAAVVGSLEWPYITKYRASVRTQSPKVEMIDALYNPSPNGTDEGIMRELFIEFYRSSAHKPKQIIIFRDGVSESQFNQVLNIELPQIVKAYHHLGEVDIPKFTVVIAQKNHHTKLFKTEGTDNVPPGTVVDTTVVHPRNYDFYMCAHNGAIGTSRPAHYHVLIDEIGFTPDQLQNLIHSLSYVYQRSTTAISIVAPVCYAHLAAAQVSQFIKFDDFSDKSSSELMTSVGSPTFPALPKLHENVEASMFFC